MHAYYYLVLVHYSEMSTVIKLRGELQLRKIVTGYDNHSLIAKWNYIESDAENRSIPCMSSYM